MNKQLAKSYVQKEWSRSTIAVPGETLLRFSRDDNFAVADLLISRYYRFLTSFVDYFSL